MPESPWPTKRAGAVRPLVHYSGFLIAGLLALAADLLILEALILVGSHPLIGRIFAISIAMVVSWLINRTVTFAMPGPPSLREYLRFAAVSWTSQAVNYSIFGAILILRPSVSPLLAVVLASMVSMFVSYFGFRYGVFTRGPAMARPAKPRTEK
jgi:putative flippase GtrA